MDGNYLTNPLVFLVQVLFGAYIVIVLLRFLLQWVRADFYNPVSQFIVKATSPVLQPLRRFIPGYAGLDLASLVFAWLLQSIEVFLLVLILGAGAHPLAALIWSLPELIGVFLDLFLFAILIQVIASWVAPQSYSPALSLIAAITRPVLQPAQRLIPPAGGLDFSPMVAMVALVILKMLLIPPLQFMVGSPFR